MYYMHMDMDMDMDVDMRWRSSRCPRTAVQVYNTHTCVLKESHEHTREIET